MHIIVYVKNYKYFVSQANFATIIFKYKSGPIPGRFSADYSGIGLDIKQLGFPVVDCPVFISNDP